MNVNQVVNAPKKSNNVAIIIGASVLVCCLFSLYLTFMRSRDEGKGLAKIERAMEEKPPSPGPIIRDMKVTTSDTSPSGSSGIDVSIDGGDPVPLSTKPMKVHLYKTRDCSGEPTDSTTLNKIPFDTAWTLDKRGRGEEHFACCMKMENADVNATYTLGFGDEKSEHTINIKDLDKVILMEGGKVPPGVFNMHINGPLQCAQDLHIKASPIK
tara:strand:+ start:6955 stop:7590 length:636 start_codon:yes stop_codon:yes gene_type:complete